MADNDNTPANYQDALDHEGAMIAAGAERFRQKAADSDPSSLKHVHQWALPKVWETESTLKDLIHWAKSRKSTTAEWVQHVENLNLFAVAYTGFMCALDGADKEWTMTELKFNIGRAVACLSFETAMMATRPGRRLIERLTRAADLASDNFESRADFVEKLVSKQGFHWDNWERDDESLCLKVGAAVLVAVQKANRDVFEPEGFKANDDHEWDSNFLVLTAQAIAELEERLGDVASASPVLSPMNTKPLKWGPHNIGPYVTPSLAKMVPLVKRAAPEQKQYLKEAMWDGRLDDALLALNTLQETPYVINEYVVDAVDWVRKRGLSRDVTSFPHTKTVMVPKEDEETVNAMPKRQRRTYWRQRKKARAHNRQARANRTKLRRTIDMARGLTEWSCFYLPHNWDKRGRIYHVPDFGHHNTDHMRAMLMLANKTRLGEDGVKWLMFQCANSYGNKVDKRSLDDRLDWVREHEDEILAAGTDFKGTFDFWRQADDPFQFLAACHELAQAMEVGEDFMTGLPIALDATMSGIQHFAAASLNHHDGYLVNLDDRLKKPNDLYTACLDVAKVKLDEELQERLADQMQNPANDNEKQQVADFEAYFDDDSIPYDDRKREKRRFNRTVAARKAKRDIKIVAAQQWQSLKSGNEVGPQRKHIKRNCMTWAYSSREFGFAKQLQSDHMDPLSADVLEGKIDQHPFEPDDGHEAAFLLADINEKAIESVVQSAQAGMEFFQRIASIMGADGKHFNFLTPHLGFPMHQYYRPERRGQKKVYIYKHEMDLQTSADNGVQTGYQTYYTKFLDGVNGDKSKSGISPNVIHAMDSTHLMMTVLMCVDNDVTDLMVVHDSFATTAGNAPIMSAAIREAFIKLYDGYCLYSDILAQAQEQHSDPDSVEWPPIPPKGDQNGDKLELWRIRNADYPFS